MRRPRYPRGWKHEHGAFFRRVRPAGAKEKKIWLGRTYAEALAEDRRLQRSGVDLATHPTVETFAARWLEERVVPERKGKGPRLAAQRLEDFVFPALGGRLLVEAARPSTLRALRATLDATHLSAQSVHHVLADFRGLLRYAAECEIIPAVVWPHGVMPRVPEKVPAPFSDVEIERLRRLPGDFGFAVRLGAGTGMRWGEIRRADAGDLRGSILVVARTKSGRVRRIPLEAELEGEVQARGGRLVSVSAVALTREARAIVPGFLVKRLRDHFACAFLAGGGSLAALQELLGHASIVTTQRYARLGGDMVEREVRRVAAGRNAGRSTAAGALAVGSTEVDEVTARE